MITSTAVSQLTSNVGCARLNLQKFIKYTMRQLVAVSGFILSVVVQTCPSVASSDQNVSVGVPENPPFAGIVNGKPAGVIAEVAVEALKTWGFEARLEALPFARVYKWVHAGKLDVGVSLLRTEERAGHAYYSKPVISEYTVIVVPKGRAFRFEESSDLNGKRLGGIIGFHYLGLDDAKIKFVRERNYRINLEKVVAGKIDGILIGSITGPYLMHQLGLSEKLEILPVAINVVRLGIALSSSRFTAKDQIRMDRTIESIHGTDTWRSILRRNQIDGFIKEWPLLSGPK